MPSSRLPLVSVIIPTYNSARTLDRCLASLVDQHYSPLEIIVVDQESQDSTASIAARYGARLITQPRPQFYTPPSHSRNVGAAAATGRYLLHLDSDMQLQPDVISSCVRMFIKGRFAGLVIHECDVTSGFWGRSKALERSCLVGRLELETARFFSASAFLKIGGYDTGISAGEDWDIDRRLKQTGPVGDSGTYLYHHQGPLVLSRQLDKKFNYGRTSQIYFSKTGTSPFQPISTMLTAYLSCGKKILVDPLHFFGFLILRLLEAGAIFSGMAYAKMFSPPLEYYRRQLTAPLTGRAKACAKLVQPAHKAVVDIGCSFGWLEYYCLRHKCASVIGLDPNPNSVRLAGQLVPSARFLVSRSYPLPLPADCADVVCLFEVIEHVPQDAEMPTFLEIYRILKPGGRLVISTPNSHFISRLLDPAWYFGHRHYSASHLSSLLTQSGFRVTNISYGGGWGELLGMIHLYFSKWVFGNHLPGAGFLNAWREREYASGTGFATLFIQAQKL